MASTTQSRIVLIRHGQTEWSSTGRHTSTTDLDLDDEGERRAAAIPALLWGLSLAPATVWCSPRMRAQRTATLAGLHADETLDDLAEWSYGDYEGRTSAQIHETNPGWMIFTDGAPGGEAPEEVAGRADRVLDHAREALAHGDVALVGHGHMSRVIAARWAGLPIGAAALFLMDAAALTVLGTYHGEPCIEHSNVVPLRPLSGAGPAPAVTS